MQTDDALEAVLLHIPDDPFNISKIFCDQMTVFVNQMVRREQKLDMVEAHVHAVDDVVFCHRLTFGGIRLRRGILPAVDRDAMLQVQIGVLRLVILRVELDFGCVLRQYCVIEQADFRKTAVQTALGLGIRAEIHIGSGNDKRS